MLSILSSLALAALVFTSLCWVVDCLFPCEESFVFEIGSGKKTLAKFDVPFRLGTGILTVILMVTSPIWIAGLLAMGLTFLGAMISTPFASFASKFRGKS